MALRRVWVVLAVLGATGAATSSSIDTSSPAASSSTGPSTAEPAAEELGAVRWGRGLSVALETGRGTGKPVFVLFQEVPGCGTCVGFGRTVLSHPLLVEAIESEFVPVLVYNNRRGGDAEVLARFDEPSWNFPVVRFLDSGGRDILPRRDGLWTPGEIGKRMVTALERSGRTVPGYLALVAQELGAELERGTFAMSCFWEGEARLGRIDGVVATRAGWREGHEVVEVAYDPGAIDRNDLALRARAERCADVVWNDGTCTPAKPTDRKFHLKSSPLRWIPLTPCQSTKVNAALHSGEDPSRWLSPRQLELARAIDAAMGADPRALEGLVPAEGTEGLAAYDRELCTRLSALGQLSPIPVGRFPRSP